MTRQALLLLLVPAILLAQSSGTIHREGGQLYLRWENTPVRFTVEKSTNMTNWTCVLWVAHCVTNYPRTVEWPILNESDAMLYRLRVLP